MANPNPDQSNLKPFQPGQSGNPGGKSSEQRKAEVEAGEKAAKAQALMLDALLVHVESDPVAALEAIKADPLKLIKDALDRANGTPIQTVDSRSSDGSMSPRPVTVELIAKTNDDSTD